MEDAPSHGPTSERARARPWTRARAWAWWLVACAGLLASCASRPSAGPRRAFDPARDVLSFTNETVWEYRVDPATGRQEHARKAERPAYALHCFGMARLAKEFFLHARFDPASPPLPRDELASRVRAVVRRGPRGAGPDAGPVTIPGHADLRALSEAEGGVLRDAVGGAWRSYLQRGNWRMVLPFTRGQRGREAARIAATVGGGGVAVVHLETFPALTLNHAVLVHAARATPGGWEFEAWDPNDPGGRLVFAFDRGEGKFRMGPTRYFAGGTVEAYEVYRGWAR